MESSRKQSEIIGMFDQIAGSYDLVNRVLTFGIDRNWRRRGVKLLLPLLPRREGVVVDVACGTGEILELLQLERERRHFPRRLTLYGVDPSREMLKLAQRRIPTAQLVEGEAGAIPLPSHSADAVTIGFGLRNVVEIERGLEEFYRILKRFGYLLILEFTRPETPSMLGRAVQFYTSKILPIVGGLLSRNGKAYRYLPDSIAHFYSQSQLVKLVETHNFRLVHRESLNFGQVSLLLFQKR